MTTKVPLILTLALAVPAQRPPPITAYTLASAKDGYPKTPSRMAWESQLFPVADSGGGACPNLVEASGGDQYPMRVTVYQASCKLSSNTHVTPLAISPGAARYTDVEPSPWVRSGARDVLAARSAGINLIGSQSTCGAGIEQLRLGPCTDWQCSGKGLKSDMVLSDIPVVDLEVADLKADDQRMLVAVGKLAADITALGVDCSTDPVPSAPWPTPPDLNWFNYGGVGAMSLGADGRVAGAVVWLLALDAYIPDEQVAMPSWVKIADVDDDGELDIISGWSGVGALRLRLPAVLPAAAVDWRVVQGDGLPACSVGAPAPGSGCWLYRDDRLSVDVDLAVIPATSRPPPGPRGADPMLMFEALTCASTHTNPVKCPQAPPTSGLVTPGVTLTARDAATGALVRSWTMAPETIPLSLAVVDGCGLVTSGSCSAATEAPLILIGTSNTSLEPLALLGQPFTTTAFKPRAVSAVPRGWYRDIDTLVPLPVPPPNPCASSTLPDGYHAVAARPGATTLTGVGGWQVVAACDGDTPVPTCGATTPCYSAEPGERFVVWSGTASANARYIVQRTGPQNIVITQSFMGPGPYVLWHPSSSP